MRQHASRLEILLALLQLILLTLSLPLLLQRLVHRLGYRLRILQGLATEFPQLVELLLGNQPGRSHLLQLLDTAT